MSFVSFFLVGCVLIVMQTTLASGVMVAHGIPDLNVPLVLYLGLFRPLRESVPIAAILGFGMDSLGGGVFGGYCVIYIWLLLGVNVLVRFLRAGGLLVFPLVAASAVFIQNLIIMSLACVIMPTFTPPPEATRNIVTQTLWTICISPFLLIFFNYLSAQIVNWKRKWAALKDG